MNAGISSVFNRYEQIQRYLKENNLKEKISIEDCAISTLLHEIGHTQRTEYIKKERDMLRNNLKISPNGYAYMSDDKFKECSLAHLQCEVDAWDYALRATDNSNTTVYNMRCTLSTYVANFAHRLETGSFDANGTTVYRESSLPTK